MQFTNLPVAAPLRITSPFGPRNTGIPGASTFHQGVDIGRDFAKAQTEILAVAPGVVNGNYWNTYRGWVVTIRHDEQHVTLYQHLAARSPVPMGSQVRGGQVIGIMGNSSDPRKLKVAIHLHFELREKGVSINPEPYLREIDQKGEIDMTREEMEQLIDRRVELKVAEALTGAGSEPSNWAKDSWTQATTAGIVDGRRPKGYTTREQVAQMVLNSRG